MSWIIAVAFNPSDDGGEVEDHNLRIRELQAFLLPHSFGH